MKKFLFLLGFLGACSEPAPCTWICDHSHQTSYPVTVMIGKVPTTQIRYKTVCDAGHYEQNPKSEWKCAGKVK